MEIKRILTGKPLVLLLLVLLSVSTYFFIYQNSSSDVDFLYQGEVYDNLLDELSDLSVEDGLKRCEEYENIALSQMLDGTWIDTQENVIRLQMISQIKAQYEHVLGYGEYLSNIQDNAEQLMGISLFMNEGTFAYKNTIKTAEDFYDLQWVNVTVGHDLAVTEVLSDNWTDIIALFPVFLVCGLFLAERKKGLISLVYATPGGREKLALKRMITLLLTSFISIAVLFGAKILLNGALYHGLDEWDRALQSIPVFYNVPYEITVREFWLWYLLIKSLGLFLAGLMIWLIQSIFSNTPVALGVLGIFVGVEFACTAIPSSSLFAVFRYLNILSYINYLPVFTRYLNISVLGTIISGNELVCALLPILLILLSIAIILVVKKRYPIARESLLQRRLRQLKFRLDYKTSGGGLFVKEAKKLLIYRRGLLVLIVLFALLTQIGAPVRDESPLDMYLDYYEQKYAGPITEETLSALQSELASADSSERRSALKQLILRVSNASDSSWIVESAPYEALFTVQMHHYTAALISLLFLVLLVSPIISQERQSDMPVLLGSTPAGRKKLWITKQLLVSMCAFVVWFMVYGSEFFKICNIYGTFSQLMAPTSSLKNVVAVEWNMRLWQAVALVYGLRLLVLLCAAQACLLLSSLCQKNSNAIILGCSVIVIPAALAAIDSFVGKSISLLHPLTVVDKASQLWIYPILAILLLFGFSLSTILIYPHNAQKSKSPRYI